MRCSTVLTLVALAVGAAACGSAEVDQEEATSEAEGELRALDATEVVGTITYGTRAMDVHHPGDSGKRVYRAVRFEGNAGDEIDADVIGDNTADPVLYLLGSGFRTIKSNDDRAPGDKNPQIKSKLTRSGTYYLAFRTKEGLSTNFYVSLWKTNGAVTPPPPPPPPPPAPASWKSALTGFDLWGVQFTAVLPPHSASGGRKDLFCRIVPSASNIYCSWTYDWTDVSAKIADDGTFSISTGAPGNTGSDLAGSIASDGTVTLTTYRNTQCFQTSWKWCEVKQAGDQNMPARATPIQLCRTPDQTFGQGGMASGYYLACSACNGRCEGGR